MFDVIIFCDDDLEIRGRIGVTQANFVSTGRHLTFPGALIFVRFATCVREDEEVGIAGAFNAEGTVIIDVLEFRNVIGEAFGGNGDGIFVGEEGFTRSGEGVGVRENFCIDGAFDSAIDCADELNFCFGGCACDFDIYGIGAFFRDLAVIFFDAFCEFSVIFFDVVDSVIEAFEMVERGRAIVAHLIDAGEIVLSESICRAHFHSLEAKLKGTVEVTVASTFLGQTRKFVELLGVFIRQRHTVDIRLRSEREGRE